MQVEKYPLPEDISRLADEILDALANKGEAWFAIDHTGKLFLCDDSDDALLGAIRGTPGPDTRSEILQYVMDMLVSNVVATAPY